MTTSLTSDVKETYPLSIHKTLQANLPQTVDVNKNEMHITEKGRIYVSDKYGDLVNCNTGAIEISNPLTTSSLEYGTFSSTIDQIQSQLSVGSIISLNVVKNGNMQLIDNSVVLKKNKTYDIEYCMLPQFASNQGQLQIGLYIVNTNNTISTDLLDIIPSSGSVNRNGLPYNSCIYTPSEDVRIHMKVSSNTANVTKLYSIFTKMKIKEFRNNPVNQYGGFESTTLFDGNIQSNGEYELNGYVENYNYIIVQTLQTMLDDITPIMKTNNVPVPYVISASSEYLDISAPYQAFDNDTTITGSKWMSDVGEKQYLMIDMGSPTKIKQYVIASGVYMNNDISKPFVYSILDYDMMGSNDGNTWDIIKSENNCNMIKVDHIVTLENSVEYRFYKLNIRRVNSSDVGYYVAVRKMAFFQENENGRKITNSVICDIPNTFIDMNNYSIKFNGNKFRTYNTTQISKIIGIKGQLPSLLCGGEF